MERTARSTIRPMRFAIVAHRSSPTNDALVAAARAAGLDANRIPPRDALRTLEPGDVALARLDVREELDGIEPGLTELERLADTGIEVLNPPSALAATHDKLLTARALRRAGVPHPHSWLIADGAPAPAPELPLVLKPRFGSWGRDVRLCRTHDELVQALETAATRDWFQEHGALAQELVPNVDWDLRVVVAGGRVVGAGRRIAAPGEWRTNVALGATVEAVEAPPLAQRVAIAAAEAVRADLAGIDLLPTRSGYVALEVNGAVDFRPLYAPGRDIYADVIGSLLRAVVARRALVAV